MRFDLSRTLMGYSPPAGNPPNLPARLSSIIPVASLIQYSYSSHLGSQ